MADPIPIVNANLRKLRIAALRPLLRRWMAWNLKHGSRWPK